MYTGATNIMTSTRSFIVALTATATAPVGYATAGGNKEDAAAVEKALKKDLAMDLSGLFDEDGLGTPTFVWQPSTDGVM